MIAVLLFLALATTCIGGARLVAAVLDYRDARRLADFRAEQLVAAARLQVLRG